MFKDIPKEDLPGRDTSFEKAVEEMLKTGNENGSINTNYTIATTRVDFDGRVWLTIAVKDLKTQSICVYTFPSSIALLLYRSIQRSIDDYIKDYEKFGVPMEPQ